MDPDHIARRAATRVSRRRRGTAGFALLMFLTGCGWNPPRAAVPLLTAALACYAGGEQGETGVLVVDPENGTSFNGRPVIWPTGYTARRAGIEVEVLDARGNVKATTGRSYYISFAYAPMLGDDATAPYPAAAECGYPWDFIDCTDPAPPATPAGRYCH
jgi:hypothetical protein